MTESEWLRSESTAEMIAAVGEQLPARALRLYALSVNLTAWGEVDLVSERHERARQRAKKWAEGEREEGESWSGYWIDNPDAVKAATQAAHMSSGRRPTWWDRERGPWRTDWADRLRELAGNPFRPPRKLSLPREVIAMASSIYQEKDFASLAVLADAVEEAGCTDEDLLRHLRYEIRCWQCLGSGYADTAGQQEAVSRCERCHGSGWKPLPANHLHGCWALDWMLQKKGY
jgi:hypothetical protein